MSDMKCHEEGISRMLLLPYLCSRNFSHCEIEGIGLWSKKNQSKACSIRSIPARPQTRTPKKALRYSVESSGTNSAVPQPRNERQPLCCLFLFFPVNRVLHHQFLDERNIQELKYKWYIGTLQQAGSTLMSLCHDVTMSLRDANTK